jgi:hypothetical protein
LAGFVAASSLLLLAAFFLSDFFPCSMVQFRLVIFLIVLEFEGLPFKFLAEK